MTSEFRVKSPRTEVSEALPGVPPDSGAANAVELPSPEQAGAVAAAGLAVLQRQAAAGEAPGAAALGMIGLQDAAGAFAALVDEDGRAPKDAGGPGGLYGLAMRLDAAGRGDDAAVVLAVLAGSEAGGRTGALGLAVIAARQGRMDEAQALAGVCLKTEERHPRALSIAGVCELERGNKSGAQAYLAAASRTARRREEYRAEVQIAQRALLLMHLG